MAWALRQIERVGKVDDGPIPPGTAEIIAELEEALVSAVRSGARDGLAILGIDFTTPPAQALAFARERAAELVGMRILEDGSVIPNPNAQWQIADDVRDAVNEAVSTAVTEGWSPQQLRAELTDLFEGPIHPAARAAMVARTETGFAYNEGAIEAYRESDIEYVEILDREGCLPQGHVKESAPPEPNMIGVVQTERDANGQIWTLDQFRAYRLGHPNCVRAGLPWAPDVVAAA